MQTLLTRLIAFLGIDALLPLIEETAIDRLSHEDRPAIVRAAELPESLIDGLIARTGADKAAVMAARQALGEAWADFVLSFRPKAA